jgi:serine protease Do
MPARVLVQHLAGAKANQIEEFPAEHADELILGRDPGAAIRFDGPSDDVVSRRHAAIRRRPGDEAEYEIVDLGSSNGTYVNGQRIAGETTLQPGDTIELGRGGPKLSFDLEPRPPARTRVLQAAPATRVVAAIADAPPVVPQSSAHTGVGRETVARMLSEERRATTRLWLAGAAAVLVLVAGAGGLFWWFTRPGVTPAEIAADYGKATVRIYMQWQLYDKATSKPVFQKVVQDKDGHRFPAYVALAKDRVVRWLTLDDGGGRNVPIGESGRGSGFVVGDQGFILTNKHVAAGWMLPYDADPVGVAFAAAQDPNEPLRGQVFHPDQVVAKWVPDSGILFDGDRPSPIGERPLEGRDNLLNVRFMETPGDNAARLLRASKEADAALVKVDSLHSLQAVVLAPPGHQVSVGDRVFAMGYPANIETVALKAHFEMGAKLEDAEVVEKPTLTEGIVARLLGDTPKTADGRTVLSPVGEVMQLTINASGAGNSGGPVFDAAGQVIGLFTYAYKVGNSGSFNESGAVPIKYGRQLLEMQ